MPGKKLPPEDVVILEAAFAENTKPSLEERKKLVDATSLDKKQIDGWFRSRRKAEEAKDPPVERDALTADARDAALAVKLGEVVRCKQLVEQKKAEHDSFRNGRAVRDLSKSDSKELGKLSRALEKLRLEHVSASSSAMILLPENPEKARAFRDAFDSILECEKATKLPIKNAGTGEGFDTLGPRCLQRGQSDFESDNAFESRTEYGKVGHTQAKAHKDRYGAHLKASLGDAIKEELPKLTGGTQSLVHSAFGDIFNFDNSIYAVDAARLTKERARYKTLKANAEANGTTIHQQKQRAKAKAAKAPSLTPSKRESASAESDLHTNAKKPSATKSNLSAKGRPPLALLDDNLASSLRAEYKSNSKKLSCDEPRKMELAKVKAESLKTNGVLEPRISDREEEMSDFTLQDCMGRAKKMLGRLVIDEFKGKAYSYRCNQKPRLSSNNSSFDSSLSSKDATFASMQV